MVALFAGAYLCRMSRLQNLVKSVLKEAQGLGAYGVYELMKGLKSLRMMDISIGAKGDVVAWYHSNEDGQLYEVVINPVRSAIHPVPAHLKPKTNESDPFSAEHLKSYIVEKMGPLLYGANVVRDSYKYCDFVLNFDRRFVSKERFIEELGKRVMVEPYTFSIIPSEATEKILLRYRKS